MKSKDAKILIVDDEHDIRKILRLLLQSKGYCVEEASNGAVALEKIQNSEFDLIIMDIMMPQMSGIETTVEIRKVSMAPVLFLTAKSLDSDKEIAYVSGGDDYLVKPFSSVELTLKVESLLRRYTIYKGKQSASTVISLPCGVEVNLTERTVTKRGENPGLRDKENDIFFFLLENRGVAVETNAIYEAVWQEKALSSSANNVMVNMLNIRKKLEDDPSNPKIIKTVWGKGYQLG